jgi:uncharacterized membrane protein (UPF0127 family)
MKNKKKILFSGSHSNLNVVNETNIEYTRKSTSFYFLIVIAFFLVGFFLISHQPRSLKPEDIKYVKIAGQNIKVDLALTPSEQEQGLSGRTELKENTGMLFVFPQPGKYGFWMKDMNFPIDMIWLGEDFRVVYIKKNASPLLYPEVYGPGPNDANAEYVLEVVNGFSDKNNLKVGDSAIFTR